MKNFAKILLALMLGTLVIFSTVACDLEENTSGYSDDEDDEEDEEEKVENEAAANDVVVNDEGEYVPEESEDVVNPEGPSERPLPGSEQEPVGELTVSTLADKVVDTMGKVQSCELVSETINMIEINGQAQNENITSKSTIDFSNDVLIFVEGEIPGSTKFDSYIVADDSTVDVYYYYHEPENMWIKQTGIPADVAKFLKLHYDSFAEEKSLIYIELLGKCGEYTETDEGYVISGGLSLNDELLDATGLGDILSSVIGNTLGDADIERILSSLSEMYVEVLVDKNTFEIKTMEVDMTKTGKDLYDTLFDILAPGVEISVAVNDYRVKNTFSNYGNARTPALPAEAQNAQEMTIFQY